MRTSQSKQPGFADIHPQWVEALADYSASRPAHDELLRQGEVRGHWLPLLRQPLTAARCAPSTSDGSRQRRRDPLPFIIAAEEWQSIEVGLEQRARLLNAIHLDLYGAQRLWREQGFPPGLAFANPRYLPACRPGHAASGTVLALLAFDLGRAPDGGWRVLANRTETPDGLGLALDNRVHATSVLKAAAQEAAIASLTDALNGFGTEVRHRGQAIGAPPEGLCVLLAGDAAQSGHADWSALGKHLGLPVLEGNDFAVRQGAVFAKTLGGLEPVAAVVRLVESNDCDPLTLSPTTLAGVPGLLNAATQRRVAVINPIGSGAVDSDALNPFLPALCEHLLDEPLLLPSPATWWCGQRREAAYVLERLEQLAVGEAFGDPCGLDADPAPAKSDAASGSALRAAIQAQPYRFAGREPLRPSTAPCLTSGGQVKPAPVTLRLFVAATASGYRVLPGGLARTANGRYAVVKDVWIAEANRAGTLPAADGQLPTGARSAGSKRPETSRGATKPETVNAAAGSAILTRRLGDDLFWLGRYLERAQTSIRILTALGHLIAGGRPSNPEAAQALLRLLSSLGFADAADDRSPRALDGSAFCRLLFEATSGDGLLKLLDRLRLTVTRRRGILPAAAWQAIEDIHQAQQARWRARTLAEALRLLDSLALRLAAFSGLLEETLPRDQGFWLQRLGKHIERLRLLAAVNIEFGMTPEPMDANQLLLLLQLHNLAQFQAAWGADAGAAWHRLVGDADHPRSLRHQADRIDRCLERLSPPGSSTDTTEARNCARALIDELAHAHRAQEAARSGEAQRLMSSASARAAEISALVSAMWLQPQSR